MKHAAATPQHLAADLLVELLGIEHQARRDRKPRRRDGAGETCGDWQVRKLRIETTSTDFSLSQGPPTPLADRRRVGRSRLFRNRSVPLPGTRRGGGRRANRFDARSRRGVVAAAQPTTQRPVLRVGRHQRGSTVRRAKSRGDRPSMRAWPKPWLPGYWDPENRPKPFPRRHETARTSAASIWPGQRALNFSL